LKLSIDDHGSRTRPGFFRRTVKVSGNPVNYRNSPPELEEKAALVGPPARKLKPGSVRCRL